VKHKRSLWSIENEIIVPMRNNKSLDLRSVYKVKPVKESAVETAWESDNRVIKGKFNGRFFFFGGKIISTYASKDGVYKGFEIFEYTGSGRYENTGSLLLGERPVSSWRLSLSA